MKTKLTSVLCLSAVVAGLALATVPARAEPGESGRPEKKRAELRRERGDRLEKMKEHLGLTDEQVAKLKPVFEAERAEMQAAREKLGEDATRKERMEAARAIHEKYRPQIAAVLTEEQKAKLEKMRDKMRERGPGGPGGPGGEGPDGPDA